ncbi:MAG: DUF58 domain-containing protein [Caldilineaceae bacterium]|nr:DUF58 domain-containing protein [Caldilineaceae bacterium]
MQVIRALHLPRLDGTALWNRGLPAAVRITHQLLWPLFLVPWLLLNQLVTPHPVWVVLLVSLVGLYGVAWGWVRQQAHHVTLTRRRTGALLVAGDELTEEFVLYNGSPLPVLWAELIDHSDLLDYYPGRVVGCGGQSHSRWQTKMTCRQRGVYQLGPHELKLGDPFHLFALTITFSARETILIYPRVLHLPTFQLPQGSTTGSARRQRPLWGAQPATTVRDHQPTDSLRYVHWPLTAHRAQLMVKELATEPSGAVWLVLDLNQAVHTGEGEAGTLEYSIMVAASVVAQLLSRSDQPAVGLLTIAQGSDHATQPQVVSLPPQSGQAQLWAILAALAPVQPSAVPLVDLLRTARRALGRRSTLVIVTAQPTTLLPAEDWPAQLVHLQTTGVTSSVCLVSREADPAAADTAVRSLLARYQIPVQYFVTTAPRTAALTFRRTRKVIRSTPTGGVVTYEEEVEVG